MPKTFFFYRQLNPIDCGPICLRMVFNEAMVDWYEAAIKDYDAFAAKYPVTNEILEQQNDKVGAMKAWCEGIDIQFTPTFFINGYQLPEIYSIGDVKYLLS